MRGKAGALLIVAIIALIGVSAVQAAATPERQLRGVRPKDVSLYSGDSFRCLDGSATISAAQLNDEYCDCSDGSDEPGTSACANSRFFCRNIGAKSRTLPSSRVNDGICDCCDGSDEEFSYSRVSCPNTCEEAGREARETLARDLAAAEAGVAARAALLEKAKASLDEKRSKMAHYEKVLAERKVLHEQARVAKEAEEAIEQAERDRRAAEKQKEQDAKNADVGLAEQATETIGEATQDAAANAEPIAATEVVPQSNEPAAAAPTEEPAAAQENFPYPAEYAYNPDAAAAAPAAAEEESKPAEENFPYPAEYAYNPDAAQQDAAAQQQDEIAVSAEEADEEEQQQQEQQQQEAEEEKEYMHPGGTSASAAARAKEGETDEEYPTLEAAMLGMWRENFVAVASWITGSMEEGRATASSITSGTYPWARFRKRWSRRLVRTFEWIGQRAGDAMDWVGISKSAKNKRGNKGDKANGQTTMVADARESNDAWTSEAAEDARVAFSEVDSKLKKLQAKMSQLQDELDRDYGAAREFEHMDGECYPLNVKQYVYEVCPYAKASQKEGHSTTSLGSWDGVTQAVDGHWRMQFKGGQGCWQGPQRSLTVHLRCGAETVPLSVEEPSKCVYDMQMQTPAVCSEHDVEAMRKRATGGDVEEEEEDVHRKDEL